MVPPRTKDSRLLPPRPPRPQTYHQRPCGGADGLSEPEGISLKRVAVVEDFFDIIYSMHVESSAEPGKAPKHAGQKKTYRAAREGQATPEISRQLWAGDEDVRIAETYAFLPREAVTRFLMSCTECQKRMHFNSNGLEPKGNISLSTPRHVVAPAHKTANVKVSQGETQSVTHPENEPPSPLVSGIIDYNMPLTSTYLKQMKLRVMNSQEQEGDGFAVSSKVMEQDVFRAGKAVNQNLPPLHSLQFSEQR
ncbi:hypothetical protein CB1_000408021 [Camelus ferus]|nr:hypothetical protein CB1_000408021 [Camelus ferus]